MQIITFNHSYYPGEFQKHNHLELNLSWSCPGPVLRRQGFFRWSNTTGEALNYLLLPVRLEIFLEFILQALIQRFAERCGSALCLRIPAGVLGSCVAYLGAQGLVSHCWGVLGSRHFPYRQR